MNRRRFIAAAGSAVVGPAALAGCLGGGGPAAGGRSGTTTATKSTTTGEVTPASTVAGPKHGDDLPADEDPEDGYPPEFETVPPERSFDMSAFETTRAEGETVSLAPIEAAYNWYARREARFVDARGESQYRRSHVLGAVVSTAGSMNSDGGGGPVADWPEDDRVVCYCGCPHHLSSIRAAELQKQGHSNVYVIDEGFWEWHDRSYPMAGEDVGAEPSVVGVEGVVGREYSGQYATAVHRGSGQREAAPIDDAGRFRLELRFSGVTASTPVVVRTPAYEVSAPLGELADGLVTGPA